MARDQAARNLGLFPEDVDAILTTAAGCGSGMREYPTLFQMAAKSNPLETELIELVERFARKVQDISAFLDSLGIADPPGLPQPFKLAYHDACHLAHAQRVTEAPRRLLRQIPNLTLVRFKRATCAADRLAYIISNNPGRHLLGSARRSMLGSEWPLPRQHRLYCANPHAFSRVGAAFASVAHPGSARPGISRLGLSIMARYFTVEQANDVLVLLRPIVAEILEIRQTILERQPEIWPSLQKDAGNGGGKVASQVALEFARLDELVRQIQASGALLKDINMGLLDFPSLREGREVYLCWRYGEDSVQFWHDRDTGFAGRQPL
jgi:hypothetical protein